MATRIQVIAVACFTTLAAIYFFIPSAAVLSGMTSQLAKTTGDLDVRISGQPSPSQLEVTIRNSHPSQTITLLSWDTPFDPQAINSGVLCLENAKTGEEVQSPGMKLNRKLPPPREDLIEISAGSTVTKNIALDAPWIPADGQDYRVHYQGSWRAMWAKSAAQITDEELASFTGDAGLQGGFSSDKIEVRLNTH